MRSEVRILSGAMILDVFCLGPVETNGALVVCEKTGKTIIIDAPVGMVQTIIEQVKESPIQLEALLLTHSHWDHTLDAAAIEERFGIPLYVHELDAANVEKPGSDGLPCPFDVDPAKVDHFLKDGQKLQFGELELEVIHTPGHTPGGVCFYLRREKLLISGDTLFRGSIGNLSFSTANPEKMWESLEKLSKLPPETRVIPGHGEETTIGAEHWLPKAKEYFGG